MSEGVEEADGDTEGLSVGSAEEDGEEVAVGEGVGVGVPVAEEKLDDD